VAYLGRVALVGSLILVKYLKASGLFGACRPSGILDRDEIMKNLDREKERYKNNNYS
jgi:hypothetical protein